MKTKESCLYEPLNEMSLFFFLTLVTSSDILNFLYQGVGNTDFDQNEGNCTPTGRPMWQPDWCKGEDIFWFHVSLEEDD